MAAQPSLVSSGGTLFGVSTQDQKIRVQLALKKDDIKVNVVTTMQ